MKTIQQVTFDDTYQEYMMPCAIWHHLCNFKNVKNTYGGMLVLVKLCGPQSATLLKVSLIHGCFPHFFNCTNVLKSRSADLVIW